MRDKKIHHLPRGDRRESRDELSVWDGEWEESKKRGVAKAPGGQQQKLHKQK